MHNYGLITLNISAFTYLFWLFPQVLLNFQRKNVEGLSFWMHSILYLGCFCDLLYGFSTIAQWQYKLVSVVNLCSLTLQHYQFKRYGFHNNSEKKLYWLVSLCVPLLLITAIYLIRFQCAGRNFYDAIGMITNICWIVYLIPQIIKNFSRQSTSGLSVYFIFLSLFLNSCDFSSAWLLEWDYPSKVGPVLSFFGNLILLLQVVYYDPRMVNPSRWRTAV